MRDRINQLKLKLYNHFVVYGTTGADGKLAADLAEALKELTAIGEHLEAVEADARYWHSIAARSTPES